MKYHPYLKIFLKVFSITAIAGIFIAVCILIAAVMGVFGGVEELDLEALTSNESSQIIYIDSEGNEQLITTLTSDQNRIWASYDEIPQNLKDAFVAIEDERFYSHNGFDLLRTTKAVFSFIGNKLTGKSTTFGGSTITQQLVKNLTGDDDVTAARKMREISQAVNLEKKISKEKILELYMNEVGLSQGCKGVQTASQKYFGKPVSELTLAECASIAGITQWPSLYDPLVNPDKNKEKQEVVLKKMLELGYITQGEYDEAMAQELVFGDDSDSKTKSGKVNSYFVDMVIDEVERELMWMGYSQTMANKLIYSGGLKIVTTIDPDVQSAMEEVFENRENFANSTGEGHAQSSMVVIDPYTGEIKGIVGGIGEKTENRVLNRALTPRAPGSSIKPISVYGPALESGIINAASVYEDVHYKPGWPNNAGKAPTGSKISVLEALQRSHNTIAVHVLDDLGPITSYNFLSQKFGITSLVQEDIDLAPLALGATTRGITATEMAGAYTAFVNKGVRSKPYCIKSVTDSKGNELFSNRQETTVALSEQNAFIMSQLLKNVVSYGTGGGAQVTGGIFTAGKTGTAGGDNGDTDRWFVGFTPNYVGAVWYGYDVPKAITGTGGNPCIKPWRMVMDKINAGKNASIPTPQGVSQATFCDETGMLASEDCIADKRTAWFASNNIPKEYCEHKPEEPEVEPENTEDIETIHVGEEEFADDSSMENVDYEMSEQVIDDAA